MKKYKVVNKSRFYLFVFLSVYICFSVFFLLGSFSKAENTSSKIKYEEVRVEDGDTLWNIAISYKSTKSDPRDIVAEIRSFNKLDSVVIKPGDVIKVPINKK